MEKAYRRGEIYLCDLGETNGHVQNGIRPVIVLNNNTVRSPTVIVAPITTKLKSNCLTHIKLNKDFGLKEQSQVLIEQLRTVDKKQMLEYIGTVDDEVIKNINNALSMTFKNNTVNILYLCENCLRKQMKTRIVKRFDPFARAKKKCAYCGGKAYEYILKDKRR